MPDAVQPLVETARNWIRWRAAKRATLLGWIGVFAGQALAGAIVFALVLLVLDAPFNAATIYTGSFFAIGCAVSGVLFGSLWALIFLQIIGIGLGLSYGVWFNLPSWWEAAALEWRNGSNIPVLVVVLGLVIPPVWSLSCFIVHKGWIKVIDMVFSRLIASLSGKPSEADRRKAAAKDLKVSDSEADRAMRETETEPEGLTVIGRSRIVREEQEHDEPEPEGESLYGSLAVDGNDAELEGLSESAAKSKQTVDASGAVIPGDHAPQSEKPTFTDDFSSPFEAKQDVAEPSKPSQETEEDDGRIRAEDRTRLMFVTDDYNVMMTQTSDESQALLDFMERHTSTLLGLSDQEIAFLRSLPDGAGLGVAEAAMQIQTGMSSVDTTFESDVNAGMDDEDVITARPTAGVEEDEDDVAFFDESPIYEDLDIPDEKEGGDEESSADFVPEFSFSGDEAAKSMSGRRVASLLSAAAFGQGGEREGGFGSDDADEADEPSVTDDAAKDEAPVEVSQEDSPAPSDEPAATTVKDPMTRKMDLVKSGMSYPAAKAQVERELEEEAQALLVAASSDGEKAVAPDEGIGAEAPTDEPSSDDVVTEASEASDSIEDEGSTDAGDDQIEEVFGFEIDSSVDDDRSGVAEEEGTTPSVDDGINDYAADGEVIEDEVSADDIGEEQREDTEMSIEAPVTESQALAMFKTMNNVKLDPRGKYEELLELEKREGYIDTVSAYRSKELIEHLGEKPAHDLKNQIIALFRDFKDADAEKFGELASEAEAKIADLRQFPHKLDGQKINLLTSSANEMDALLKGNASTMGMERKIRLSRIRADIEGLRSLLESQSAPPVKKSTAASEESRRNAAEIIQQLSGEEVSVSTSAPDQNENQVDDDQEGEEVDMAAVVAESETEVAESQYEHPWLDPDLGDLDADFELIPEGVNINTPEGFAVLQERTALQARRVSAKEARDAHREREAEAQRDKEAEEGEERARAQTASNLAQREEAIEEAEAELQRRQAEMSERNEREARENKEAADKLEEERRRLKQEEERIGERGKVLDRLSDVFKGDAEKKVEIVRFVSDNMSGLFSVREVPVRFAQVSAMFMDLALARAIQKRVKGSSVGLQDALMSEGSEGLPERVFPNKLNMAFHGATVFRKSAEIVHKLATELEVEVSVPSAFEEEVDVQALMDACQSEDEKEFVADISSWMKSSRAEFFEMTKAMEENAHDYRLARKIESSNVQDVEELGAANVSLKRDLQAAQEELAEVRAQLKQAQSRAPSSAAKAETVEGYVDSGTAAMEIDEMFVREDFRRSRGKALVEVGQRKIAIGLLDGNGGLPSKKKVMSELEAGSSVPVVIFTDAPEDEQEDISNHLTEFAQVAISFQPLDIEVAREFMDEEIRKMESE